MLICQMKQITVGTFKRIRRHIYNVGLEGSLDTNDANFSMIQNIVVTLNNVRTPVSPFSI